MEVKRFLSSLSIFLALVAATWEWSLAIEKVRLGPSARVGYHYILPYLAAEEKGLWKESGLAAELVIFTSAAPMNQAIAAGHLEAGLAPANSSILAAAAGAPMIMTTHVVTRGAGFHLWVRSDSPVRKVQDLKGRRIDVGRFGSASHGYARLVAKAYDLEKDVKYVATGGVREAVAGLRAGIADAIILTLLPTAGLVAAGEVRKVLSAEDYLPTPWLEHVIAVRKDFLDSKPEVVRKVAKIFFEGARFVKENRLWALEKLKGKEFGLSQKAAELVYDNILVNLEYGKINREGLENVKKFLVDYGLVPKEKMPATDSIFRNIYD